MASSPVGVRPPWVKISQRSGAPGGRHLLGVDGDDDALRAEFLRCLAHEFPALYGRGVDRGLVGAGFEQSADVLDRRDAATDRERHEAALGRALHDVEDDAALLMAGGDVEKGELVRAGRVVGSRRLDGIARIAQADEIDALDDAAVLHVEAGDDADLEGHRGRQSCSSWRFPLLYRRLAARRHSRRPIRASDRTEQADHRQYRRHK